MGKLGQALETLQSSAPKSVEFIRHCPYGLVVRDTDGDIELRVFPTFCAIEGESAHPEGLAAPLAFLKLCTVEQLSPHQSNGFYSELMWFYCYAKARNWFPTLPYDRLVPAKHATVWQKISDARHTNLELTTFDLLHIRLLRELGFPGAFLFKPIQHSAFADAWKAAQRAETFAEFFANFRSILGTTFQALDEGYFIKRDPPKHRVVIQEAFGVQAGIIATSKPPWIGTKENLEQYLAFTLTRPLMLQNHQADAPVGLVFNQHMVAAEDGSWQIHADTYVTDNLHWQSRDQFKGFSVGMRSTARENQ